MVAFMLGDPVKCFFAQLDDLNVDEFSLNISIEILKSFAKNFLFYFAW